MSDKDLILGLKKGDYRCYESLFERYYARYVNFVDEIINDREAAKDLVQESFIKVWLNKERLDSDLSIGNYLYVLVKRATINFIRDRKFAESLSTELAEGLSSNEDGEQRVVARESIRRIQGAVDHLPPQRRTVFLMSRQQGLSNKEIAAQLQLSEKTIERHITLALSSLRKNRS